MYQLSISQDEFALTLVNEENYSQSFADSHFSYDHEYISQSKERITTKIGVRSSGKSVLLMASGGVSGIHERCYLIKDKVIYILVSHTAFCLTLPDLELEWLTKVDEVSCFEIFDIGEGLVIHGELEITRLSYSGKIKWQRSGSDIFTSIDGSDGFKIEDGLIHAGSWDGRKYLFDFNGNEK